MPRRYGYAYKGQRCVGSHNWQAKGRINVIGAITNFNFLTLALFEHNINSDIFYQWVRQELLPAIPAQSVIVMDIVKAI